MSAESFADAFVAPVPMLPLSIENIVDYSHSPWFKNVEQRDHRGRAGLGVLCSNPHTGRGYASEEDEPLIARHLTPGKIHRAFAKLNDQGALCCAEAMLEGCYADGCAEDADQILQEAVYRTQVWA